MNRQSRKDRIRSLVNTYLDAKLTVEETREALIKMGAYTEYNVRECQVRGHWRNAHMARRIKG